VSVIDSLTLAIALPLGVIGGVFLTLLLAACCYYRTRPHDNNDRRRNSRSHNRRLVIHIVTRSDLILIVRYMN
jgi:heme/copper-type cytochrome/quinol oxidase subunit 2